MTRMLSLALLLLASTSVPGQDMLQRASWAGRAISVQGHVIGWKEGRDASSACILVQADPAQPQPQGRVWACNEHMNAVMVQWTLEGRRVRAEGSVAQMQKTRVGSMWRFVPRIENARIH